MLTAFQAPPGRPLSGGAKDQVAASRNRAAVIESVCDGQYGVFSTPFWGFFTPFGVKKTPKAAQEKTSTAEAQQAKTFLKEL